MYKVEYLGVAVDDLDDIINYISHNLKNVTASYNLINDFIKKIMYIQEFPYANAEYKPTKNLKYNYRKTRFKNFLIFYIINEKDRIITISRILYQRRNIEKILL